MIDSTSPGFPVAEELAAVLNGAVSRGIAVCPYVNLEGVLYSLEWHENGEPADLTVEWDQEAQRWIITDGTGE